MGPSLMKTKHSPRPAGSGTMFRSTHETIEMAIAQDSVVTLHYTLKDDTGEVLDSSSSGEPLAYLHGHGNLVPGLERELTGKNTGDKLSVKISPADGYGEFDKALIQRVPRRALKGIKNINVGMRLHAQTPQGPQAVTVTLAGTTAPTNAPFDIPLRAGWNMVGDPFTAAVPLSSLTFNHGTETFSQATSGSNPLVDATVYTYDAASSAYEPVNALEPDGGYWILANSATDVQVSQ